MITHLKTTALVEVEHGEHHGQHGGDHEGDEENFMNDENIGGCNKAKTCSNN